MWGSIFQEIAQRHVSFQKLYLHIDILAKNEFRAQINYHSLRFRTQSIDFCFSSLSYLRYELSEQQNWLTLAFMRSWQKINGVIEKVVTDRQATGRPNDLLTGRKKKSIFNPSSGNYWSLSIQIHHHHWGALTLHRTLHTVTFRTFQALLLMSEVWGMSFDVQKAWCLWLDGWSLMSEA